jgi:hypothetical protein
MDIGDWLRSLGLEKYEAAFRENEIDEAVLPSLTHETLKSALLQLGIASSCSMLSPCCVLMRARKQRQPQHSLGMLKTPPSAAKSQ